MVFSTIGSSSGSAVAGMQRGRDRPCGSQSRKERKSEHGIGRFDQGTFRGLQTWELPTREVSAVLLVGLSLCRSRPMPPVVTRNNANDTVRPRGVEGRPAYY